ncbi:MAG: hypothetical protein FWE49_01365 [Synergistaceae bacterium]|nr:hypothetical protein [Synergistaceae bacterium]
MKSNEKLICIIVLILCAAFSGTTYYGYAYINDLRQQLQTLTNEYNDLAQDTTTMERRKQEFEKAFTQLDILKVGVGGNVDFYSEAQKAISRGGARVLANSPNPLKGGRRSMSMTFTGDYYAIMKALAEIRGLPNVVRVVSLNLASIDPKDVNSEIKAEVVLEALAN